MHKRFVLLSLLWFLPGLIAGGSIGWWSLGKYGSTAKGGPVATQADPSPRVCREVGVNGGAGEVGAVAAGRKVFIDPITGRNVAPPAQAPDMAVPLPADHPLSTSGDGLLEVPVATRAGGVKVHLQGRFRSSVTATVDPDGKLTTRCVTESEAADHKAAQ